MIVLLCLMATSTSEGTYIPCSYDCDGILKLVATVRIIVKVGHDPILIETKCFLMFSLELVLPPKS